ncbi:MAG: SCO family protein [Gammaproteobacteria bacterium]
MAQRLPLLLTVLVVTLGVLVWWQTTQGFRAFTWETHRRLQIEQTPIPVPNVMLEDQHGQHLELASLRGKVLVVNFIYTRCPTICGYTGMVYAQLQTALQQRGVHGHVQLLSISLEPHYDTPARMQAYMQRFTREQSGHWQTLRAVDPHQGKALLQRLGVVSIADGFGGITHNAASHIIDPQGRLVQIVDEDKPDVVLQAIERLLNVPEPQPHVAL